MTVSVLIGSLLVSCTDKKKDHEKSDSGDRVRLYQHKTKERKSRSNEVPNLLLSDKDLKLLPDVFDSSSKEANWRVLSKLGIHSEHFKAVSDILLDAYSEARRLRSIETNEIEFELGAAVTIPAMSLESIDVLVDQARSRLVFLVASDDSSPGLSPDSIGDIVILLRNQLNRVFSCDLTVTLMPSKVISTSSAAHSPIEYQELEFKVVKKGWDGFTDRFTLDPVQSKHSEYFFLNAGKNK